jgi:hypothetical protein
VKLVVSTLVDLAAARVRLALVVPATRRVAANWDRILDKETF